jgi:cyanophycinase
MKIFSRSMFLLFSFTIVLTAQNADRGSLIIIGGGDRTENIMKKFIELAGGPKAVIVVFPMASSVPDEVGPEQVQEMKQLGAAHAFSLPLTTAQANTDSALGDLKNVTGVFFSGGDQTRLMAALRGTKVEQRLFQLYRDGAVIGGTSAGAAVMSHVMITGDERRPGRDSSFQIIESKDVVTLEGFGFVKNAIVDQHFIRRRRNNRLVSVVLEHPKLVGIGIDESTAIWLKPDQTFEVLGNSVVVVYDATTANVKRDSIGYGLQAAGMSMHVLRSGSTYDLKSRKVLKLHSDRNAR